MCLPWRTHIDESTGQWFLADNHRVVVCQVKDEGVERELYSLKSLIMATSLVGRIPPRFLFLLLSLFSNYHDAKWLQAEVAMMMMLIFLCAK